MAPQPRRIDDFGRDDWVNLDDLWWLSFNGPSAPQLRRTDDLGRDGRVDLEDLWWLSFNGPSVPQSLGTVAEEDRRSWTGWPGRP